MAGCNVVIFYAVTTFSISNLNFDIEVLITIGCISGNGFYCSDNVVIIITEIILFVLLLDL